MKLCIVCHKYGVPLDDPCVYPLGFMYISAVLKQQGHDVKVLNYNLWEYDLKTEIAGQDAVLFTGFEEFRPYIVRDAAICRGMGIKTILGGALSTFAPIEMVQHIDTVIVGEGETVIAKALASRGIIQGPKPRLDDLPYPDYEGFGIDEYHARHSIRYMGVLTSRGCPYNCKFCAQTCACQLRELSHVFAEIDHYKAKYGVTAIVFNDNTLNLSKSRFLAICQGMKERGLSWTAAIRVDVFDEDMARAAKDSSCKYFVVGVESFIQKKLDGMNKRIKVDQITTALDLLHKYQIAYHGNVLTGLPDETVQDIVDEVLAIPAGYRVFPVIVQPFIGTQYQNRTISSEQAEQLQVIFKTRAEQQGMYLYPEAA